MEINKKTLTAIRVELSNMQKIVNDAEAKLDQYPARYPNHVPEINGTTESAVLQAQFKVMKHNIGKLFK